MLINPKVSPLFHFSALCDIFRALDIAPTLDVLVLLRFNKAVIILVDALRFDFLSPLPWPPLSAADPCPMRKQPEDSNRDDEDSRPHKFQNKVPAVCDLLTSRPNNSLLLKFIADPPTTTMQRIKVGTYCPDNTVVA